MRWILALVALAAGAWYLSNRQRYARIQQTWQRPEKVSSAPRAWGPDTVEAPVPTDGGPASHAASPDPVGAGALPSRFAVPPIRNTATTGEALPAAVEQPTGSFIGHKNTRVFRAATSANLPAEKNRVYFATAEEAIAAGFRPAARQSADGTSDSKESAAL